MENFHLLRSNLHVIWLYLSWMVKSKSIVLSIHIFVSIKSLWWKNFRPPLPQCQQSAFGSPPPPPPGGWRNMWKALKKTTFQQKQKKYKYFSTKAIYMKILCSKSYVEVWKFFSAKVKVWGAKWWRHLPPSFLRLPWSRADKFVN